MNFNSAGACGHNKAHQDRILAELLLNSSMGNCFSLPKRFQAITRRAYVDTDRKQLLDLPSALPAEKGDSFDESRPEQQSVGREKLQSSTNNESNVSDKGQSAAEVKGPSGQSPNYSKTVQDEQSFGDKGKSPLDEQQGQHPIDTLHSEQTLQKNQTTPTGANRGHLGPRALGKQFQDEFKKKAEGVRSKIVSKMEFNARLSDRQRHSVHTLFTHKQNNGLRVAAVVDLRNID